MKRALILVPLLLFMVLAIFLGIGLKRNPSEVPSPLVGKAAPAFTLPQLDTDAPFSPKAWRKSAVNVWATWCAPCREDLPVVVWPAMVAPLGAWPTMTSAPPRELARSLRQPVCIPVDVTRVGIDTALLRARDLRSTRPASSASSDRPVTSGSSNKILPLIREFQK